MKRPRQIKIGEKSDDALTTNWEFEGDWDDILPPILSILEDAEAHSLEIDWPAVLASAGVAPPCEPADLTEVKSPADFMNNIFAQVDGCEIDGDFFDSDCPGGSSFVETAWVRSRSAASAKRTFEAIREALESYWTESGLEDQVSANRATKRRAEEEASRRAAQDRRSAEERRRIEIEAEIRNTRVRAADAVAARLDASDAPYSWDGTILACQSRAAYVLTTCAGAEASPRAEDVAAAHRLRELGFFVVEVRLRQAGDPRLPHFTVAKERHWLDEWWPIGIRMEPMAPVDGRPLPEDVWGDFQSWARSNGSESPYERSMLLRREEQASRKPDFASERAAAVEAVSRLRRYLASPDAPFFIADRILAAQDGRVFVATSVHGHTSEPPRASGFADHAIEFLIALGVWPAKVRLESCYRDTLGHCWLDAYRWRPDQPDLTGGELHDVERRLKAWWRSCQNSPPSNSGA